MVAEHDGSCAAQAPTVQKVPKTVEVSQLQYIDEIIDESQMAEARQTEAKGPVDR